MAARQRAAVALLARLPTTAAGREDPSSWALLTSDFNLNI